MNSMDTLTIKAGQKYVARNGEIFTPERVNNGTNYCFQQKTKDGDFVLWLENGLALARDCPSGRDLVSVFIPRR